MGDGIGVTTLTMTGSGLTWLTCSMTPGQTVSVSGLTVVASASNTAALLQITYSAAQPADTQEAVTVRDIDLVASSGASPGVWLKGVVLNTVSAATIATVQQQSNTAAGSCLVDVSGCSGIDVLGCRLFSGDALVHQSGFASTLKIGECHASNSNWLFNQAAGMAAGITLTNLFVSDCQCDTLRGGVQAIRSANHLFSNNLWNAGGANWFGYDYTDVTTSSHVGDVMQGGATPVRTGIRVQATGAGTSFQNVWQSPVLTNFDVAVTFGTGTKENAALHAVSFAGGLASNFQDAGTDNRITWLTDAGFASLNGWTFGGGLGQPLVSIPDVPGAVNTLTLEAAPAGAGVTVQASGPAGTNVDLVLQAQGTGVVRVGSNPIATQPLVVEVVVGDPTASASNTLAIQTALNTGLDVSLPYLGNIYINAGLSMTTNGQQLSGLGPATRLRPGPASIDVLTISSGTANEIINVAIRDLLIWPTGPMSATVATAGIKAINGGHIRFSNVWLGSYEDVSSGEYLYNGLELNECGDVIITGGGACGCRADGILIYAPGSTVLEGGAEIFMTGSVQVVSNMIGVHVAGNMGGVYIGGDIQLNNQGVVVDITRSSQPNREIFLDGAIIDSSIYEGFIAQASSIAASLVVNRGWCGGSKATRQPGPVTVGFSVMPGNAVTIINGMRCDGNIQTGAYFAGGPVVMSNFHADQNGTDGIQIAATCGGIFSTNAKLTGSSNGAGWNFLAPAYGYEVSIVGGSVNANAGGTIINAPRGVGQYLSNIVGYEGLVIIGPASNDLLPAVAPGGAIGWNYSDGNGEINFWNTYVPPASSVPANVSFDWHQRLPGGGNIQLMSLYLSGGVVNTVLPGNIAVGSGAECFQDWSTSASNSLDFRFLASGGGGSGLEGTMAFYGGSFTFNGSEVLTAASAQALRSAAKTSRMVRVENSGHHVSVTAEDDLVAIYTVSGHETHVTLESDPVLGASHVIKDAGGEASINNVVVRGGLGKLIDGAETISITADHGYVRLIFNGAEWNVV